ncbi:MAG: hypothetical protein QOG88_118 [Actinomycetota bacterium]|nr:hypothetical protein [Actinomycetota bacterium]
MCFYTTMHSPPPGDRLRTGEALLPASVSVLCLLVIWLRTAKLLPSHPWWSFPADHHVYLYMAQHPVGRFRGAPWAWRLLEPGLVRASPFTPQVGFAIVASASLGLTGLVLYAVCRRLQFSAHLSLYGVILFFGLSYAVKFNVYDFWLTDPLAFFFTALGVFAAIDRRRVLFAACLAVGVLAKESVIFVAPLYLSLNVRTRADKRLLLESLLVALPAVLVLVAVRVFIPAMNADPAYVASLPRLVAADTRSVPDYSPSVVFRTVMRYRLAHWSSTLAQAVSAFGVLIPALLVFGGRKAWELAVRLSPFLVLVFVQLAFAFNTQRLVVLAFPAVIALALGGVERLVAKGFPEWLLWGAAVGTLLLNAVSTTEVSPSAVWQVTLLVGIAAAGLWVARVDHGPTR